MELLAGIPSVVYGFFGAAVISRLIRNLFGGTGYGVLAAAIILAIMILPTLVSITEVSIRSVPAEYREASLAIGATGTQTIGRILLPTARSGILAGIVLGIGRAIGETPFMAFSYNYVKAGALFALTMNIVTDMGYASGLHLTALFATSMVLFILIMILNGAVMTISRRAIRQRT